MAESVSSGVYLEQVNQVGLQITQIGEQVLRESAHQLSREEIVSAKIQELIEHMRETMRNAPGVGLAAPQVGIPLQVAVIEDREEYHKKLTPGQLSTNMRKAKGSKRLAGTRESCSMRSTTWTESST